MSKYVQKKITQNKELYLICQISNSLTVDEIHKKKPYKGLRWFKWNVQKMSNISIIELSRLGQDLFDFSDLT